ncbi:MAG: RidA family protein [Acidimicrobiaceae bacterium]|nr:RidA family protein [Acidimicrobiaceae bacterium]MXZ99896.1 RidA family protein [Acidimicrobiaceae bacterium]MYE75077.1 RidA family protein [Acidimicrobiaceae bacterium]MYE98568.1 RidA family protein [Acidimicrobiaceae bacterium]MYH43496.1 RidA family protein [Acidimicrobiaceae bacterium]
MTTPHRLVNPPTMAPATGFAHAVLPAQGQTVYVAGQTASDPSGAIVGGTFCEQYDVALGNVVEALRHAGGDPADIVSLVVYTTDMKAYRDDRSGVGAAHRKHLGRHYPAMALLGVTDLFDADAMVEIIATAVIPTTGQP